MSAHADYFAIKRVSWSLLKNLDVSPAYFRYREKTPVEDTPAMRMGRAVHSAVLEPEDFPREYVLFEGTRRGKVWDEFAAVNAAKTILTVEEYDRCLAIAKAVRRNKDARRLLSRTKREQTVLWTASGIKAKARVDAWKPGVVIDIKTTRTLDERRFTRLCHDFDYFGQLNFYTRGLQQATEPHKWQRPWDWSQFVIGVEQEAPHDCAVWEVDEDSAWYADQHVTELLALLAACRKSRRYPGRYEGVQTLSMPEWAMAQADLAATGELTGLTGAFKGDV